MLSNDSLAGLIREIVSHIDRLDELNRMQEGAFALAKAQFKWGERGERFRQAIADVAQQSAGIHALGNTPQGAAEVQDVDLVVN
jgi:hypothetical protein